MEWLPTESYSSLSVHQPALPYLYTWKIICISSGLLIKIPSRSCSSIHAIYVLTTQLVLRKYILFRGHIWGQIFGLQETAFRRPVSKVLWSQIVISIFSFRSTFLVNALETWGNNLTCWFSNSCAGLQWITIYKTQFRIS